MELFLRKMPGGSLVADNEETAERLTKLKVGGVLRGDFKQPRNYAFLQKTMTLFKFCYDHFADSMGSGVEFKGVKVEPNFDRFREDLTIMAGHYTATFDIRGDVKFKAKSLSYGSCSQEESEKIYSDVINAALRLVYLKNMDEQELRKVVDVILGYA